MLMVVPSLMLMMLMMDRVMMLMLTHCVPLIDLHSSQSVWPSMPHPLLMPRDNPIHTNGMPTSPYNVAKS